LFNKRASPAASRRRRPPPPPPAPGERDRLSDTARAPTLASPIYHARAHPDDPARAYVRIWPRARADSAMFSIYEGTGSPFLERVPREPGTRVEAARRVKRLSTFKSRVSLARALHFPRRIGRAYRFADFIGSMRDEDGSTRTRLMLSEGSYPAWTSAIAELERDAPRGSM